jgi:hypothetical protein
MDGHYPNQNLTRSDDSNKMLVDFNMFPLRLQASGSNHHANQGAQECVLATASTSDAPYSSSRQANVKNKVSPSGYTYDSYPYMLEFDNYGHDNSQMGKAVGQWGFDEISWYANQKAEYRRPYLTTLANEVAGLSAANGHVAMPGKRTAYISSTGASEYIGSDYYNMFYDSSIGCALIPIWDIAVAGDIGAVKAAWEAIGAYDAKAE